MKLNAFEIEKSYRKLKVVKGISRTSKETPLSTQSL